MTAKRYTLQTITGEPQLFAKKDSAIRAGEKIGEDFTVLSPAGAVVYTTFEPETEETDAHEPVVETVPEPVVEEEDEDLIGEPTPEAHGSFSFPGNYSISFVKFAQTLADAIGGLDTHIEKPGGLTRVFHFAGSKEAVSILTELLNDSVPATLAGLRVWQKENIESRRGKTDMEKFLEHRSYIERSARTIAEGLL